MADFKPFKAWRPDRNVASRVAALPYDVYSRSEAYEEAKKDRLSFLNIDRPETQFDRDCDMYSEAVYEKAGEMLSDWMNQGIFIQDEQPCFYLYELTMDGRSQTGIVGCAGVDDYLNQIIKKHENTRAEKEMDRIRHVDVCNAQTGPIFLAYHHQDRIDRVVDQVKNTECVYDFISEDGIGHRCWVVSDQHQIDILQSAFNMLPAMYIADGHHRAASAVKVCMRRREAAGTYDGDEAFNSFLAVAFPDNQLKILPYYRVVKDLNGLTKESFLAGVQKYFEISKMGREGVSPREKLTYGCYLDHQWYLFKARPEIIHDDPVEGLDVSVLQDYILEPLLGIHDPKTDRRIDFVGGIRGIGELERRCHTDMCIAFSTCATEMSELFAVADANRLMPPKSTWFEPKLRSGLFIHQL